MLEGLQRPTTTCSTGSSRMAGVLKRLWDDRQHGTFNFPLEQAKLGIPFIDETGLMIDKRAFMYFYVTYLPKNARWRDLLHFRFRDSSGKLLNGKDTYRLRVPADTPAEDFWSVIVYSMKTKGFVKDAERVGLGSTSKESMAVNDDGTVDIYFAPKLRRGKKPTGSRPAKTGSSSSASTARKGWFESGWKLPDIEKVN